ncbi:MAG: ABC transporter permease [Treponema sp.]|nr:ABC transporter permease [Treponema sp.]
MSGKNKKPALYPIYLIIILVIMYIPIILVIVYSFNRSRLSSVWGGFTFSWYTELFKDRRMFEALLNSLILAILSSLLSAILGTLGATGMAKIRMASKTSVKTYVINKTSFHKTMESLSILPIMAPEIILGMAFLAFFSLLAIPWGMFTLVIAHTAFCIPYPYLLVRARLAGLDKSYIEAARIMGASGMRAFYDITLPLMFPAIVSGILISFAMSFDDVIVSSFVAGNTNTLPMVIYSQLRTGVTPKTNALCSLLFILTIILCTAAAFLARRKQK